MAKKLTLYLDEEVIEKARLMSRRNKKSISKMVESFLKQEMKRDLSHGWANKWVGIADAEEIMKKRKGDKKLEQIYRKHVK